MSVEFMFHPYKKIYLRKVILFRFNNISITLFNCNKTLDSLRPRHQPKRNKYNNIILASKFKRVTQWCNEWKMSCFILFYIYIIWFVMSQLPCIALWRDSWLFLKYYKAFFLQNFLPYYFDYPIKWSHELQFDITL